MSVRKVKRNGRGQIVSYELESNSTQSYDSVVLSDTEFQEFEQFKAPSFKANVDSDIKELLINNEYASRTVTITDSMVIYTGVEPGTTLNPLIPPGATITQQATTVTQEFINSNPSPDLGYIFEGVGFQPVGGWSSTIIGTTAAALNRLQPIGVEGTYDRETRTYQGTTYMWVVPIGGTNANGAWIPTSSNPSGGD